MQSVACQCKLNVYMDAFECEQMYVNFSHNLHMYGCLIVCLLIYLCVYMHV